MEKGSEAVGEDGAPKMFMSPWRLGRTLGYREEHGCLLGLVFLCELTV